MSATPLRLHTQTLASEALGRPFVMLHGLLGRGRNFQGIARSLTDTAPVTLIDLPNHGASPWTDEFSFPLMADIVAATLREGPARQGPVNLLGHSLGGKVAMTLALQHPELVDRLVVEDIAPIAYPPLPPEKVGTSADNLFLIDQLRSLDLDALTSRADADAALQEAIPDAVVRPFLLQNLVRTDGVFRWQPNLQLLHDVMPTIYGWPELSGQFPGETLWMRGSRSAYIQPEWRPAMEALFPKVRSITIKDAGHWIHAEQPQVVTDVLRRFLQPAPAR